MVGHEPRVPGVEGGGAAGDLDSEAGSEDSQEQEPGQEHGHGQHGAGHYWVLSSVSPFSIFFRKQCLYMNVVLTILKMKMMTKCQNESRGIVSSLHKDCK